MSFDQALWLIDTSVLIRAALGDSPAAAQWMSDRLAEGELMLGSRWLQTEARRVAVNFRLRERGDYSEQIETFLGGIVFSPLDDEVLVSAGKLECISRAGDAIHLATAVKLARFSLPVTVVTHDAEMAAAALTIGLKAHDPVTDDPRRPPVAGGVSNSSSIIKH
jgi:predicted nucleic acid-binding protein